MSGLRRRLLASPLFHVLFSGGATAVPGPGLLAMAGLFTAVFLFLPWSSHAGQVVFIVAAFVLGVSFAALYWWLARPRSPAAQLQSEGAVDQAMPQYDGSVSLRNHRGIGAKYRPQEQGEEHSRCAQLLSQGSAGCCSSASSCPVWWHIALPTFELCVLGLLVLLSPHVMVTNVESAGRIVSTSVNASAEQRRYPVANVWKVNLLHAWFLFAFQLPLAAGLAVGLLHFAVLMAHFSYLGLGTMAASLLWLLVPLCCLPFAAVQQHRQRCCCWRRLSGGLLDVGGDTLSSTPHASHYVLHDAYDPTGDLPSARYALRQAAEGGVPHRQGPRAASSGNPGHFFAAFPALPPSLRQQTHSVANDAPLNEPLDSVVLRHTNASMTSSSGIQPPYLLLSPNGGIILGTSESFAAHVGMTMESLMGRKFLSVLGWLAVENMRALADVIQEVASASPHDGGVAVGDDGAKADRRSCVGGLGRRSLQAEWQAEAEAEAEAVKESREAEYSTAQGAQSPARMGDGTVQRILLRGRRPCRPSSAWNPPLAEDQEAASARARAGDAGKEFSPLELSCGGGEYFCLSLDVWMGRRRESTEGLLVLCQPRLHCVLDWTPLACFVVHPLTGCVLHWSREAERQTGRLAYDVVGWQAHALPAPHSTGFGTRRHDGSEDNVGEGEEARRRGARLEPPLQAILQLPPCPALAFSVTLQPLTGSFVEEEGAALEGGVTGLVWPPLHSSTQRETRTTADGRRAASYPLESRWGCAHGSAEGEVGGDRTPFPPRGLPEPSLKASGGPAQGKAGWCFAALANGREVASAWVSAGVPLLFTVHEEASMPLDGPALSSCVKPGQDSMHASAGVLPEHQTVWENLPQQAVHEVLPAPPTVENGVADTWGAPPQGNGAKWDVDHQSSGGASSQRGGAATHAPHVTETDAGKETACNEDDKQDPGAKATGGEGSLKLPQLSTRPAVGLTPTQLSLQASLCNSQHSSPLLGNARKVADAEPAPADTLGGGSDANEDGRDDGSKQRGQRGSGSGGRTALTPLGDRSPSKVRAMQVPRLISPLPRETPTGVRGNDGDARSETVFSGRHLDSNPQQPSYSQQLQPSLLSPQPLASFPAASSAAESMAQSDFAALPIPNANVANAGPPIWAMLRSSDEATIPSCFIRVPPGEGFLFGRSSKCHATTVDGFVSSIQFKIVRQLASELQLVQPASSQASSHHNPPVNPLQLSTSSGPHSSASAAAAAGNWVVVLYDQSVNGTFVDVRRVGKGKYVILRDRDLITFRLSSSQFFLGFQFLLTDERGTPLLDRAAVPAASAGINSSAVSRGTLPLRHRPSSECGSVFGASGSNNNNGGGSGRRPTSATRSRSSRAGAAAQHRETLEWKIGEEVLGKGGNAEVFLGINLTNGKLIAVKRVLLPTLAPDDPNHNAVLQQYRSLQEEIKVLSKAMHPNIVQYLGSSQNPKYFNILLEFVPGGSLRHLLDNFGALSPGVICSYLRQTLEGLHYLHQHNLVHSDVKAANILITDKGRVKLSDFGTAKLLNRQHSQSVDRAGKAEVAKGNDTATFRLAGTLRWMAPELFRGSAGPTRASDIWSVGCALIEMLSTEAPWSEYEFESEEQIMNLLKYTTEPPEVPECAELPELTAIARRCLTLDADSRPSCEELLQLVLEAAKRYQEQQAKSPSPVDAPAASPAAAAAASIASAATLPSEGVMAAASAQRNSKHEGRAQHRDPQEPAGAAAAKGPKGGDRRR
ncbi:putative protein kinase [Trypanosoma conorhini]|uniref:Protein kinase domain-containing protein n=1 Tax=Trypanosoma conorhini TaxID=83891 RepID=A0A422Q5Z4_9TRYP|nr:putative protein kinase [Trypanosoma conorhini]RNF25369.1 putative protein kinase [Trypanosoma conorhini]